MMYMWLLVTLAAIIGGECSHIMDKGRVQMGVSNHQCDDAKWNTKMDMNCKDFLCPKMSAVIKGNPLKPIVTRNCSQPEIETLHVCMENRILYNQTIPSSGPHRPLWPKYGEYAYVPPQRWLHNIEHGAAVFLYHPCLERAQVEVFRRAAQAAGKALRVKTRKHKIYKYIFTPYNLPRNLPFAVVKWRCLLQMNIVDKDTIHEIRKFVTEEVWESPEGTNMDGQYGIGYNQKLSEFIEENPEVREKCYWLLPKTFEIY